MHEFIEPGISPGPHSRITEGEGGRIVGVVTSPGLHSVFLVHPAGRQELENTLHSPVAALNAFVITVKHISGFSGVTGVGVVGGGAVSSNDGHVLLEVDDCEPMYPVPGGIHAHQPLEGPDSPGSMQLVSLDLHKPHSEPNLSKTALISAALHIIPAIVLPVFFGGQYALVFE